MALQVSGKTAIVTGAGSGINLAFAKLLLSKGCNVLIADLSLRPEAKELVAQHSAKAHANGSNGHAGARVVFQETNVADWTQLERMFQVALKEFGRIDVVCPGAGVFEPDWSNFWFPPGSPPSRDDAASSRFALLDINLTHPIRTTQLAIDHFIKTKQPGVVVIISSIAGQLGFPPTPLYVASKHAISGFTRAMGVLEFPPENSSLPKIRVAGVAPGIIKTPIWTDSPEKMSLVSEEKGDVWITPEAVAEVMLDVVQKEENVGGTILEIGKGVRRVEAFNDPGPQGEGHSVSGAPAAVGAIFQILEKQQKK